jgi:hypothetical protein
MTAGKLHRFFVVPTVYSQPTQPPIQWVPGALSPGVNRPGRETDHSHLCSALVNNVWSYTSSPPYVFVRCAQLTTGCSITADYGLDDRMIGVRIPVGAGSFSLRHRVQNGFGAHPASYPMGTGCTFPGGKSARAWSWPLISIWCRGRRMYSAIPPLPQYASIAWCSVKHRDNFTFIRLHGMLLSEAQCQLCLAFAFAFAFTFTVYQYRFIRHYHTHLLWTLIPSFSRCSC